MKRNNLIRNNIKRFRFENNEMTQEELAKKVGVTRQTISALEANRYVPSVLLALMIARTFSVHVEEVFSIADDSAIE